MRVPKANPVPACSRYRYSKRRYRAFFQVLDCVGHLLKRIAGVRTPAPARPDPRSILLVQLDHVGDAVLTTPMLRALRQRFPNAAIDVLASSCNRDVFRGNPHVRRVHVSDCNWHARTPAHRSYFAVLQLGRLMRGYRYDLGIDPRGDFLVALVLWLARIPRRIGWAAGGGGFLLTDTTTWVPQRHEIDSRLALVRILGGARGDFEPELYPNWADSYAVREALAALPNPQLPVVVLHHGAGTAAKRWPLENWSELLQRLGHETAATVILVGDSTDQARARQLARGQHRVVDWTGRLTLMQLAALLGEADLFIGGDSGPAHVAAAMGTPTVVLFSGTNRAECWRPFGSRTQILRWPVRCSPCHLKTCPVPGHLCMSGIRPSAVLEAVRQIIASIGCATGDRALSHAQPEP